MTRTRVAFVLLASTAVFASACHDPLPWTHGAWVHAAFDSAMLWFATAIAVVVLRARTRTRPAARARGARTLALGAAVIAIACLARSIHATHPDALAHAVTVERIETPDPSLLSTQREVALDPWVGTSGAFGFVGPRASDRPLTPMLAAVRVIPTAPLGFRVKALDATMLATSEDLPCARDSFGNPHCGLALYEHSTGRAWTLVTRSLQHPMIPTTFAHTAIVVRIVPGRVRIPESNTINALGVLAEYAWWLAIFTTVLALFMLAEVERRRAPSVPAEWMSGVVDASGMVHVAGLDLMRAPVGTPAGDVLVRVPTTSAYRAGVALDASAVFVGTREDFPGDHHARATALALGALVAVVLAVTPIAALTTMLDAIVPM